MNKKNQFVLLIEVLLIAMFAKLLSLSTKIIMTRELGVEAMSLFSLVNPLILLLLTLSSLSLQNSIGSIIAKNTLKRKTILRNALLITLILNGVLISLLAIFSYFISSKMLNNIDTYPGVLACIFVIPLTSISSIIKGYFIGIGELKLSSFSQIFEECGRLLFLIIILYIFPNLSPSYKASIAVFSLCIGEIFQVLYMLIFYKNSSLKKYMALMHNNKGDSYYHEILKSSIPLTLSRLVGSLTYFVEPILFTSIMLKNNFSIDEITISYGILNSYVLPLIVMPGFISVTLSNLLIPNLGKYIRNKQFVKAKKFILEILILCFVIGLFISSIFKFFPNQITSLIYKENFGAEILKKYSLFFIIYYIETPLITCLLFFNLSRKAFFSTCVSSITRIILIILLVGKYQIDGVIIALIISTYIDVLMNLYYLLSFFIRQKKNAIFL